MLPVTLNVDGHRIMKTKAGVTDIYVFALKHGQLVVYCRAFNVGTLTGNCFVYMLQGEWLNRLAFGEVRIVDIERVMCGVISIRNRIWSGAPAFECRF